MSQHAFSNGMEVTVMASHYVFYDDTFSAKYPTNLAAVNILNENSVIKHPQTLNL